MKIIENAPVYKNMPMAALQVDVELAKPAALYNHPEFDGLLAWAVVQEITRGRGLTESSEPYYIPLPLEKLWTCPRMFAPLWNATRFFPLEENTQQTAHWHKRGYKPEMVQKQRSGKPHNANFRQGAHKEYRMPLPVQSSLHWRAFCVGNLAEVQRLLGFVHSIGKKRTQGHGVVAEWRITEIENFEYFHQNRYIKTFPVAYPDLPVPPDGIIFNRYEDSWTPPYWLETLFQECIL